MRILPILFIIGAAIIPIVEAANSYLVYNVPPMRLNQGITATETDIDLSPPIRNGEEVSFPALSGGIIELRNSRFQEYIYYGEASVDSSTLVVTLSGAVRGYCWDTNAFQSCESGRVWAKGTEATLVDDFRLFNTSVRTDVQKQLHDSGKILSGSGTPGLNVGWFTTAQRDSMTNVQNGDVVGNSTIGALQARTGGSWQTLGGSGVVNATLTVAGKVEIASTGAILAGTATGSTGAENVLSARYTTASGGLSTVKAGHVPVTESSGFLSGTLLGQGATSSTFLRGDQTFASVKETPLFGDGSDGAKTVSASEDIDPTNEYEYTTLTIDSSQTLGVSSTGSVLVIKTRSDVTINGTIDLDSEGGDAGSGGLSGQNGNEGTDCGSLISDIVNDAGNGGTTAATAAGGGGGSSILGDGTAGVNAGGTGGAGGTALSALEAAFLSQFFRNAACGAGGGGGGADTNDVGGDGGDGGGSAVLFVGGDLTLGASSVITADGDNGQTPPAGSGEDPGGGGGGGGGVVYVIVGGSITDNGVSLTATGGSGGTGPNGGGDGGAGKAGKIVIYSLQDGTLISS